MQKTACTTLKRNNLIYKRDFAMAILFRVERKIKQIEGFSHVAFFNKAGRRVNRFSLGVPDYPFNTPMESEYSVQEWQQKRIAPIFGDIQARIYVPDFHGRFHEALDDMSLSFIRQRSGK